LIRALVTLEELVKYQLGNSYLNLKSNIRSLIKHKILIFTNALVFALFYFVAETEASPSNCSTTFELLCKKIGKVK